MEKNSGLPHQIFSWKFYFYETKIILGRPALTNKPASSGSSGSASSCGGAAWGGAKGTG